jgi:hypothetical protein
MQESPTWVCRMEDDPIVKLTVYHHIPVSIKATLFLGYRACANGSRQNGDGYIGLDEEFSSQIIFNPADPGRSFLESSFLPLYD